MKISRSTLSRAAGTTLLLGSVVAVGASAVTAPAQSSGFTADDTAAAQPARAWVANPDFEDGVSDWFVQRWTRLDEVPTERMGEYAARIRPATDVKVPHGVAMRSAPSTATVSASGQALSARVYVRVTTPGLPVRVKLREIDRDGRTVASAYQKVVPTATDWRPVTVDMLSHAAGTRLALRVAAPLAEGSDAVIVDGAEMHVGARPACELLDYSDPDNGVKAWGDEFDGSKVDPSKWRVRDGESLSYDAARIQADNVDVSGGLLHIRAEREQAAGREFTTGYVDSITKYSRQYGRWEIRAKVPTTVGQSRGIWPAFWLRGDRTPGEIDVMEAWGEPTIRDDYRSGAYAWAVHKDTTGATGTDKYSNWGRPTGADPVADGFHLYAVDWSPSCLVFSFDGEIAGVVTYEQAPWLAKSLDGPVNIRLNLQIGQNYWGFPDADRPGTTRLPADFQVDYVRVYRPL